MLEEVSDAGLACVLVRCANLHADHKGYDGARMIGDHHHVHAVTEPELPAFGAIREMSAERRAALRFRYAGIADINTQGKASGMKLHRAALLVDHRPNRVAREKGERNFSHLELAGLAGWLTREAQTATGGRRGEIWFGSGWTGRLTAPKQGNAARMRRIQGLNEFAGTTGLPLRRLRFCTTAWRFFLPLSRRSAIPA